MTTAVQAPVTSEAPPPVAMMQMITGSVWISKALYVAAKLGIADLVAREPRSSEALAKSIGAHAPSLRRVLRALASVGVFAEDEWGRFGLTPLAATLQSEVPGSFRAMAVLWGEPWHWHAWGSFLAAVRTGENGWAHAHGASLFDYLGQHPDHARLFNEAMTSFSAQEAGAVVESYDFTGVQTVVDVGGGHGLLLATILHAYPPLRGVLFELPPVAAGATKFLEATGVADRCEVVTGSFFESVPGGGDAYLLKNILHDFDDAEAVRILRNCRHAMRPEGRLLVVQEALPPGNTPSVGKLLDLQMLLIGGRERTEAEYRALYAAAGFQLTRVLPTPSPLHLIEGMPV